MEVVRTHTFKAKMGGSLHASLERYAEIAQAA